MKKTFPLTQPGKVDARVVESVKNEIRKYLRRERRKQLPAGFECWEFACKVGTDAASATTIAIQEVNPAIDAVVQAGARDVYIEVVALAAHRSRPAGPAAPSP